MNQQHDLEALKAALKAAKAVLREKVKVIVEAKRAADDARRKLGEVQRAYFAALPPSKRPKPRPARVEESVFALATGNLEVSHRHGRIRFGVATGWNAEAPDQAAYLVSDLFDAWHRVSEADYEKLLSASKANPNGTPGIPLDERFGTDKLAICFGDTRVEVTACRFPRRRPRDAT